MSNKQVKVLSSIYPQEPSVALVSSPRTAICFCKGPRVSVEDIPFLIHNWGWMQLLVAGISSQQQWNGYEELRKMGGILHQREGLACFFPMCSMRCDDCITISAFRRYEAIWNSCILSRCKLNDVKANLWARGLDHAWALAAAEMLCDNLPVYNHVLEPLSMGKSGATP